MSKTIGGRQVTVENMNPVLNRRKNKFEKYLSINQAIQQDIWLQT